MDVTKKQEPVMLFFDFIVGEHYTGSQLYSTDDKKKLSVLIPG